MDNDFIIKILLKLLVLFTALPVHEFAHGWMAVKFGDDTPEKQGRLTLNPFAHLELIGSVCMLFSGFGWAKPVMINPSNFKKKKLGCVMVSLAGPFSNMLIALISMIVFKVLFKFNLGSDYLQYIFVYLIMLNVGLAVFNLIPIPPLDGSKVLTTFLPEKASIFMLKNQPYMFLLLFLLLQVNMVQNFISLVDNAVIVLLDKITFFI